MLGFIQLRKYQSIILETLPISLFFNNQRIFTLSTKMKLERSITKVKPKWGSPSLVQVFEKSLMRAV